MRPSVSLESVLPAARPQFERIAKRVLLDHAFDEDLSERTEVAAVQGMTTLK